jgi:hypothetical protein
MRNVADWVARQFDGGLTLIGVFFGLGLMGTGVGALMALSSGSMLALAVLGIPFLLGLGLLLLSARYTDPELRMSPEEKRRRWALVPAFMKRAGSVLMSGLLMGAVLSGPVGHSISWALIALSSLIAAHGVHRWNGPIPNAKGGSSTVIDAPSEYRQSQRQALRGLYVAAALAAAMALLPMLKLVWRVV